jgi:hypothetical protein
MRNGGLYEGLVLVHLMCKCNPDIILDEQKAVIENITYFSLMGPRSGFEPGTTTRTLVSIYNILFHLLISFTIFRVNEPSISDLNGTELT